MKLHRMEFGGFRTFANPVTFDFGAEPGLYFLEGGRNDVDPSLGSNGVGKSTVWAALCWILFGKTADGLKAGDLKSWQADEKGYYGKLWLGDRCIERTWRPNSLKLDGEEVEQSTLESAISTDFDTFTSAVVLAQGNDMFFDLSPARKLALFTSILKLDNWITYSALAKDSADRILDKLHATERNISKLEGKLDGLGIEDLEQKRKNWRSELMSQRLTLKQEIRTSKSELESLTKTLRKARQRGSVLKKQLRTAKSSTEALLEEWTECRHAEDRVNWEIQRAAKQIRETALHIKRVKKYKRGECSQCGQKINKGRLVSHVKKLRIQLDDLKSKNDQLQTALERAQSKTKIANDKLEEAKQTAAALNHQLDKQGTHIADLAGDCALVATALDSKEQRLLEKRKEKNPFIPLLAERKDEEQRLTDKLHSKERQHGRMQKKKEDIEFWVQGFKEVRLYLVEEALEQLEIETNKALGDLGFSTDWRIKYAVDRRTQKGTTISGFNVLVHSPHNKKPTPFAAWSGGERQRLKIAGSIGFIALASARTGVDFGIEVYDEPTQHLSPQGIDSLLETLRVRALENNKRIWLVDHHTLDYGEFTGRTIVNKQKDGSTIWQL